MALLSNEEAEALRVKICAYAKEHRDFTKHDLMQEFGMTNNQCIHHLKRLTQQGFLARMIRRNTTNRLAIYNEGKRPYQAKVKTPKEVYKEEPITDLPPQAKAVCTVHRLLDRKVDPSKKRELRKTHAGSMQSGMAMFGNW
jgi:hypothetical protein